MEIAHETGAADRSLAIRELKKAQDVLGDLHDRQELIDNLSDTSAHEAPEGESDTASQISLVKQVIDAECRDLHGRYLARRAQVQDICRGEWTPTRRIPTRSLVAAGALALSSGIYARLR